MKANNDGKWTGVPDDVRYSDASPQSTNARAGVRVALLGATGRTGKELLALAREKGLQVNALARRPDKLGEFHDYVVPIEGNVTDPSAVERVVAGCSAVLSVLGPRRDAVGTRSRDDLLTIASLNTVAAMKKEGVRRLIVLTNTAVKDPSDRLPLAQKTARFVLRVLNDRLSLDSIAAASVISNSGLDWTLVRPAMLTDGPRTGNYRVGALARGMPLRISRADVAEFMISCLTEGKFVRGRPALGGGHAK